MQFDKPSTKYVVKKEMILWLQRQEVACVAPLMRHPHLYKLNEPKMPPQKRAYGIDHILNTCNYVTL